MAEVTTPGGIVSVSGNALPRESGISEVFAAYIFPVVVAGVGGSALLPINQAVASFGPHTVFPGVRQGVLTETPGGLVDFTDWVWKIRFLPWCGIDPPVVRGLTVRVTPYSNDPTGREITLSIAWGDGMTTPACPAGLPSSHTYATSGRYTLTVRATNHLGDSAGLSRDVVVVDYPVPAKGWRPGQSPGSLSTEVEPDL